MTTKMTAAEAARWEAGRQTPADEQRAKRREEEFEAWRAKAAQQRAELEARFGL